MAQQEIGQEMVKCVNKCVKKELFSLNFHPNQSSVNWGEIFSFFGSQSILGRPFVKNYSHDFEQDPPEALILRMKIIATITLIVLLVMTTTKK